MTNMKRFLLLAALLAPVLSANADTATVNGVTWTYTVSNGKAKIYKGEYSPAIASSTTGAIEIPSTLGSYPVTSIGKYAFCDCSGLTSITIPGGVTSIGSYAFWSCSGLTSITIPDGVTSIGSYAFQDCSGLTSITIPDSVKTIGSGAFWVCSGLTSITIPGSVTSIGSYAFQDCSGLRSITIPGSVTSIGSDAFSGCSELTSIIVDESNSVYDSRNNCNAIVRKSGNALIAGCCNTTIPDSVTSIGDSAFYDCSGLTSITIPDSVTSIGKFAFLGCSGLTAITLGNSVTSIGDSAFGDCSGLTSITIPDSVWSIGSDAFYGCSGLTSITIPDGVTSFFNDTFQGCSGLTSIIVEEGNPAFDSRDNCNAIIRKEDNALIVGCCNTTIPDGVKSIAGGAFDGCSGLTSLTIPDSVTSIDPEAFSGCSGLTSITIPESVTSIGWKAFYNCSGLTSITIPDGVTSIGHDAFRDCSGLTSVEIGNGVTSIGDSAFYGCSGLTSVMIGNGVTSIGSSAFWYCSGLTSVTFGNSVTSIGDSAFYDCSGLTSIAIPDSVTNIGDYAFSYCSGLTSIMIPDSVTSIGNRAFYGCSGLTSVTIGNGVTSIGYDAFWGCSGLSSITIPDSVTSIGSYAFYDCSGLTSVMIGNNVRSIGNDAFYWCFGLKTLYLPNSYSGTPSVPSGCRIIRYDKLVSFSVSSPFGAPVPNCNDGIVPSNVVVSCSVPSPVEVTDGVCYACTGWRGTGSVPANGTSNRVDVLMLEDSSIEWLWETNVWIECEVTGEASLSGPGSGWFRKDGAWATFSFVPDSLPFAFRVSGDAAGIEVDPEAGMVSIPADRPRTVGLHVLSLGDAGEAGGKPLDWTGDAGAPWFAVEDATATDGFSLRSGEVAQGGTSALETTVTGPGRLSFAWRFAAGRNDFVRFYVDDEQQAQIGRETTAWATNEVEIAAGQHSLRWAFERGSTAGGAGFLDDVRWIPNHTLTVASTDGTPTPAVGTHEIDWGTAVEASVAAPTPTAGGKTRRACTGWTGTGSVPASGTETNVTFTAEADSTLTWNWRTEHWIDVAVASGGSTWFEPQWVAEGETVCVIFSPNWSLYDISIAGDTNGVVRAGSYLHVPADGPRTIRATFTERKLSLAVATPMGEVSPAQGTHLYSYDDYVTATAVSPLREANGEQVVCSGWTGRGSVWDGSGTSVGFYIYEDSSITWTWATNVWIDVAVASGGSTSFQPHWVRKGTTAEIELTPATHLFTVALSGDVLRSGGFRSRCRARSGRRRRRPGRTSIRGATRWRRRWRRLRRRTGRGTSASVGPGRGAFRRAGAGRRSPSRWRRIRRSRGGGGRTTGSRSKRRGRSKRTSGWTGARRTKRSKSPTTSSSTAIAR